MVNQQRTTPPHGTDPGSERTAQLRDLVVEAALEVLDRDGLGLRADSITYAKVFAYLAEEHGIRVTRGSVHDRIWPSQDHFRREVLMTAASHTAPYEHNRTMHDSILRILEACDGAGLTGRRRVWAFARVAGRALLESYLESPRFRQFQMIKAAARVDDGEAAGLLRAMVRGKADGNQEERLRRFTFMFDALGMRPRRELGLDVRQSVDVFMTLLQMLVTGAHLDHHAGFRTVAAKAETDLAIGDEAWPWTYFGFGFLAFIELLFELDPDADPAAVEVPDDDLGSRTPEPPSPLTEAGVGTGRPRRSREELRRLVVAAGVELLLRDGLGLKAESLTYASVFTHIKESRGISIHRSTVHPEVWSSPEEFRSDVLAEAARCGNGEPVVALRQAMAAPDRRPSGAATDARQLILDGTRALVGSQIDRSLASPTFSRWQSIKAALLTNAPDRHLEVVRQAVDERYDAMVDDLSETFGEATPLVGLVTNPALRMSDEQAHHLLAVLTAALTTGAEYNISAGAELAARTVPLPRADGSGRCDDWPMPAVGALAVLDLLFVPADEV